MNERNIKIAAVIAAGVAVIAVLVLVFTTYSGRDEDPQVADGTSFDGVDPPPDGSGVEPPPSPSPTDADGAHDEGATLDPQQTKTVLDTATGFMTKWLEPGDVKKRQAAMRPYATDAFIQNLKLTDTAQLPTGTIQGTPKVADSTTYTAAVEITLSGGERYRCDLLLEPRGWRVSKLVAVTETGSGEEPAETAPGTAEGGEGNG